MNLKSFVKSIGFLLGAMLVFSGGMVAAPAASAAMKSATDSREATGLFRDIRKDAMKIDKHAWRLERLTSKAATRWRAYDRQWNAIRPAEDDMHLKLDRLTDMRTDLTSSQWATVQRNLAMYGKIETNMHTLRILLDEPGIGLSNPELGIDSMILADQARRLARTV